MGLYKLDSFLFEATLGYETLSFIVDLQGLLAYSDTKHSSDIYLPTAVFHSLHYHFTFCFKNWREGEVETGLK